MVTCLNDQQKVQWWVTPAVLGYKDCKKRSVLAAKVLGEFVGNRLLKDGTSQVEIRLKGIGPGRHPFLSGLRKSGVTILALEDVTQIPHNGCRSKKKRRI